MPSFRLRGGEYLLKIADIKFNDVVDCDQGICVSLWTQGCPHHCNNCHNPETWNFNGGREVPIENVIQTILDGIKKNNIKRNFSVLGGEPLCPENKKDVLKIIWAVRHDYPNIKIFLWTGYIYEELLAKKDDYITNILNNIDVLIDGPYIDELRDITLPLRGSSNQRIIQLKK